jgi:hypothetical protein
MRGLDRRFVLRNGRGRDGFRVPALGLLHGCRSGRRLDFLDRRGPLFFDLRR